MDDRDTRGLDFPVISRLRQFFPDLRHEKFPLRPLEIDLTEWRNSLIQKELSVIRPIALENQNRFLAGIFPSEPGIQGYTSAATASPEEGCYDQRVSGGRAAEDPRDRARGAAPRYRVPDPGVARLRYD
jgi:hypothetical protein